MTAGQSAGRDVESINEEAARPELLRALRVAINDPGQCLPRGDDYTEPIGAWGARAVVASVLPLLRLSDVPGLERQLRDKIAGEDAALLMAADSVLSLIRYRRPSALNEQTVRDLDAHLERAVKARQESSS